MVMKCPFCRGTETEVFNTRTTKSASQIWRRRRCRNCHESFTTYEALDMTFLDVIRPGYRKVPYQRSHLFSSLSAAFLDLPHKADTIDAITDTIETKLLNLAQPAVSTGDIARITLTTLKHFNTAAFLRYLTAHADVASTAELKQHLKKY